MTKHRNILFPVLILAIAALACNMPTGNATETATEAPTEEPTELSPEDIAATTAAESPTEEPTNTKVTVTVSLATNCRTGPDAAYQLLMVVQPGTEFEVVGKYTPKTYWIITMPGGGTCWLWGQYAAVEGDTSKLPEMAAPAAPPVAQSDPNSNDNSNNNSNNDNSDDSEDNSNDSQPNLPPPPATPSNVSTSRQCNDLTKQGDLFPSYKMFVTLSWTDNSDNETGFNIFKDGTLITTLPANTQQFTENFVVLLPPSSNVTYGVQALGSNGASNIATGSVKYCP